MNELKHHGVKGQRWGVRRNLKKKNSSVKKKIKEKLSKKNDDKKEVDNKPKTQKDNRPKKYEKKDYRSPEQKLLDMYNDKNSLQDLSNNRWLSKRDRAQAKSYSKDPTITPQELKRKNAELSIKANLEKAKAYENQGKKDLSRVVAKGTVDIVGAFKPSIKQNNRIIKSLIDATDRNKSTDQVVKDLVSSTMSSAAHTLEKNPAARSKLKSLVNREKKKVQTATNKVKKANANDIKSEVSTKKDSKVKTSINKTKEKRKRNK